MSSSFAATSQLPPLQAFDVLIVGAGAAGLYTSLCLPKHLSIGLITKEPISLSASDWAQGGIAAVIDPNDSSDLHIKDTLIAGAGLCDYDAVKFLVERAPQCIRALVEMGVGFDRHHGTLALTLEAAHSRRRVLHAADTTGRALVSTLAEQVLIQKNIQVLQGFALDLWMDKTTQRCLGIALVYGTQIAWIRAEAVILATGGGGQVFAQTTNPELSTGDGVAIAHRAGVALRDLEFVQFHPTALTKSGAPRFLISEAVRGEGAHLVDDQGRRFAFDYHPDGELAPRDVVSRAIFSYLQATKVDPATAHVWLDLRPIPADKLQHRFPNIIQVCKRWGIDVFNEPIPVAPAAHYWMGGITTDIANRTSISGLYAVGETASTGVQGANRLASNSLLECLVFGAQFREMEQRIGDREQGEEGLSTSQQNFSPSPFALLSTPSEIAALELFRRELPRLMWQSAGICRNQDQMKAAIAQVETWQQEFAALPISRSLQALNFGLTLELTSPDIAPILRLWGETRNLLEVAILMLKSANFRTESRGGHYRLDYPQTQPAWQVHTLVQANHWWTEPVGTESKTMS
ncbi:L-aspartate oxidase [Phormidium sp. CLA17]|uniref:L-aspartate oxidase n=1 Tax=Leptolyngbya sp. Cla-17 TaxID=2803751 RepID=UPI0018D64F32|nr:L-aspartate oxidase [Leptolyngbya sp. Cla-17]MBM0740203.1 L-aspartate oxidase [Leptolyngbya sp. Cla-17]